MKTKKPNKTETLELIKEAYMLKEFRSIASARKYLYAKGLSYDQEWTSKQQELFHIDRFNHIHKTSTESGLKPIFLTLTLPSKYHQFKSKDGGHVQNPKWDGSTITDGCNELIRIFRKLYNDYKVNVDGKRIHKKLKYSRVIEPHKDFTPHLHAVVYVEEPEHYKAYFDDVVTGAGLEQTDFVILKGEAKQSINYLLKYVAKTIAGDNAFIQGWKKTHGIVMVRTSNLPFTKLEYVLFKSNVAFDKKYDNYYHQMEEQLLCIRHTTSEYYEGEWASTRDKKNFIEDKRNGYSFKSVSVGNSVNPLFVIETVRVILKKPKTVNVIFDGEECEDTFMGMESITQHWDDRFSLFESSNDADCLCDDEMYMGNPIPVTDCNEYYYLDDEYHVTHTLKNATSVVVYSQVFSNLLGDLREFRPEKRLPRFEHVNMQELAIT